MNELYITQAEEWRGSAPATEASAVPSYIATELSSRKWAHALVIPVLNEGLRLRRQLERVAESGSPVDVIISDGNSSDGSTEPAMLEALGASALIRLEGEGGLSSSLRAAFSYALDRGYEGVVLMDGNNKDDPDAIALFCHELAQFDFVQGSRYLKQGCAINTPHYREFLIRYIHAPLFSLLCGKRFTDSTNGFKGFSRRFLVAPGVAPFQPEFDQYELPYYLAWAACQHGFKVTEIPVIRRYPESGPTPTKIVGVKGYWRMLKPLLYLLGKRLRVI